MMTGDKVYIRPIETEDLPHIYSWMNDIDLVKYIWPGVVNPTPMRKLEKWYDDLQSKSDEKMFMIYTTDKEKPIGLVGVQGISVRSRKGDLSIYIGDKEYWGQGYGSEALVLFLGYVFRVHNLRRVALEVYEYNERAINAYEKVGFKKEGYVRRSVFKDGRYWGEYVMAIFKEDYFQRYPFERSY